MGVLSMQPVETQMAALGWLVLGSWDCSGDPFLTTFARHLEARCLCEWEATLPPGRGSQNFLERPASVPRQVRLGMQKEQMRSRERGKGSFQSSMLIGRNLTLNV